MVERVFACCDCPEPVRADREESAWCRSCGQPLDEAMYGALAQCSHRWNESTGQCELCGVFKCAEVVPAGPRSNPPAPTHCDICAVVDDEADGVPLCAAHFVMRVKRARGGQ